MWGLKLVKLLVREEWPPEAGVVGNDWGRSLRDDMARSGTSQGAAVRRSDRDNVK